jgi:PAS domain S-box-containing protein
MGSYRIGQNLLRPAFITWRRIERQTGMAQLNDHLRMRPITDDLSEVLRDFFDNAPIGLHWQLYDGTIQNANRALGAMLGYDSNELVGVNFFGLHTDSALASDLQKRLAGGETVNSEKVVLRRRDGTERHVLYSASTLWKDGQLVRARVFTREVPRLMKAMQALAEADARKTAILDAALDAIITMDAQGSVVDFNRAAERIFGYARDEAVQTKLSTLVVPLRLREAHENGLRHYLETGTGPVLGRRIELEAMRANGEEFPVELSIAVVDGEQPMFTATLRDITQRKQAELAMQDTLAALQLSEAALRNADRRKDEFIATLAHELRNPLAPVRTAVEILARGEIGAERTSWAVDVVRRQVSIMARLLDDLLDVARMTQGKLELRRQPTRVAEMVRLAGHSIQSALDGKQQHLRLDVDVPEYFVAQLDNVRVTQVLTNLLTNASKYSDANSSVLLRCFVRDESLCFQVQDDGIGFRPELSTKLFEMFSQLPESSGRDQGGLGIGLALSLELVRMHGGTLEAFSAGPDRGANFTVTLPLAT